MNLSANGLLWYMEVRKPNSSENSKFTFASFFFLILITNNKYSFVKKKNEQWKPIRGPYVIPTEHNFNWTNIMK